MAKFEIYTLSNLAERLDKIASENRYDQVSRNIHDVFSKRAAKDPSATVTSEDIKQTFSIFASMNTQSRFRDYFPEIFVTATEADPQGESMFSRDNIPAESHRELAFEPVQDETSHIKETSLEKLKETVEASVNFPEYRYNGFTKIQKYGNSGFANWTVAFNTGHGIANVNVPVVVVDGYANTPSKFVTASGELRDFNKEEISSYAKSYVETRIRAEQSSGLASLGSQTVVAQEYPTEEPAESREDHSISLNYSVPMDAQFEATFDSSQHSLIEAIETARQEAMSKINNSPDGKLNLSVQINYSGALDFKDQDVVNTPEHPMGELVDPIDPMGEIIDPQMGHVMEGEPVIEGVEVYPMTERPEENFDGVITFNASRKVRGGIRVATIMVRVANGEAEAQAFYGDGQAHQLTGNNLNNFLEKEITVEAADTDDGGVEAFSDAFLADASLNELRKELKASVDGGNMARATSCIRIISSKFSPEATGRAMSDFIAWNKDVKASRKTQLTWDEDNDPNYSGYLKSHDIHFS